MGMTGTAGFPLSVLQISGDQTQVCKVKNNNNKIKNNNSIFMSKMSWEAVR